MISLYGPKRPYAGLYKVVTNGRACHMLVCLCLLGSNLNAHVKLEKQAIKMYTSTKNVQMTSQFQKTVCN